MQYRRRRRNRDLYQIYYNILEVAREPRSPAKILRRELTSYQHVGKCVQKLKEYDLIEKTDGNYHTTFKGFIFLEKMDGLYQMLPWLKIEF